MQKKLLIVQNDSAYFLLETLAVIEKYKSSLKDFSLTILVNQKSLNELSQNSTILISEITTNRETVLKNEYDISFNLSLDEESWSYYSEVKSNNKLGPYLKDKLLCIADIWSTYLVTLKGGAPFLTFHLQDIYRNILGLKARITSDFKHDVFKTIAFDKFNPNLVSGTEYENLVQKIHHNYPLIELRDISEIDPISDLTKVLYVGPATLQSLQLCEGGALGIFFSESFQGFNLLPYGPNHLVVSSNGKIFKADDMFPIIEKRINHQSINLKSVLSIYRTNHEHLYGAYLHSENASDGNYPFYQAHVVLWNFLLSLFDTNLDTIECGQEQQTLIQDHRLVLKKLIRLHTYAINAIETVYKEAREQYSNAEKIDLQLKTQLEIEDLFEKISISFSMLRPFIDFYKIRKGQNDGKTLLEQSQNTLILLSEEHHALLALDELFSVTLKKNEATI